MSLLMKAGGNANMNDGKNTLGGGSNTLTGRITGDPIDLQAYMRLLPSSVWVYLFSFAPSLQAITRSLSELDQHIVIRLCYLHQTVSERAMRWWVLPECLSDLRRSISALLHINILIPSSQHSQSNNPQTHSQSSQKRTDLTQYSLHPTLKTQLRSLLLNGPTLSPSAHIHPLSLSNSNLYSNTQLPNKNTLITHSKQRWDNLLRFIVSPFDPSKNSQTPTESTQEWFMFGSGLDEAAPERPCDEVVMLLVRRRLISPTHAYNVEKQSSMGSANTGMSREAFSWLLKDLRSQVNTLIMEFVYMLDGGNLTNSAHQAEIRATHLFTASGKGGEGPFTPAQQYHMIIIALPELIQTRPQTPTSYISSSPTASHTPSSHLSQHTPSTSSHNYLSSQSPHLPHKHSSPFHSTNTSKSASSTYKPGSPQHNQPSPQTSRVLNGESMGVASPTSPGSILQKSSDFIQEALLALLSWSQATIGQMFLTSPLTPIQRRLLRVCDALGLMWWENDSSPTYCVAPYCLLLRWDSAETRALTTAMSSMSDTLASSFRKKNVSSSDTTQAANLLSDLWFHPVLSSTSTPFHNNKNNSENREHPITAPTSSKHSLQVSLSNTSSSFDSSNMNYHRHSSVSQVPSNLESGIIVQSNFKVYIYTSSALHISILSHLCELQARTTNLVVGLLSRDSVSAAYKSGITADQIIRFLESYSHPALYEARSAIGLNASARSTRGQGSTSISNTLTAGGGGGGNHLPSSGGNIGSSAVGTRSSPLPENVIIQLRMWEAEQHRLTMESAVLFKRWQTDLLPELFQRSVRWAIGKGCCLYHTQWPEDTTSLQFDVWMKKEKYLCIPIDAKAEMIDKIRELRDFIIQHREDQHNTEN